jgi:capsule polysaccharide modification protein KpsS
MVSNLGANYQDIDDKDQWFYQRSTKKNKKNIWVQKLGQWITVTYKLRNDESLWLHCDVNEV